MLMFQMSPHHMVNHHPMNHMNHQMNPMNHNQMCQNQMSQNRLNHMVSPTSCCTSYNQMSLDQPLTSPAAAATAPMQPMYQPHQARHCNCNGPHCGAHQHMHPCSGMVPPCHPQPQIMTCAHQNQSCGMQSTCMSPCGMQPNCAMMQQHNCIPQQQYCPPQNMYNPIAPEKEEIQCGVVSQSSNNMRQAAYQRTLEYVEQCQSWAVSSSTHPPASNMVINDMTSSLNSLMEENKYLQMIQ